MADRMILHFILNIKTEQSRESNEAIVKLKWLTSSESPPHPVWLYLET